MKKIPKELIKRVDAAQTALATAETALTEALDTFGDQLTALGQKLTPKKAAKQLATTVDKLWADLGVAAKCEALGDALSEASDLRDEIVGALDDYMSDRSEKWQESDAASSFESWKGEWESMELDAPDLDKDEITSQLTTDAEDLTAEALKARIASLVENLPELAYSEPWGELPTEREAS